MRFHAAFHVRWDADMARELQDQFLLDPSQRIARLSKGETGKLLMLLALAQRPDLLVLDEPTDGLDPVVRRDVLTALSTSSPATAQACSCPVISCTSSSACATGWE